ncbi:MAG: hypothetical protein ACXV3S_09170 [Kineosporiaceae bacterium]
MTGDATMSWAGWLLNGVILIVAWTVLVGSIIMALRAWRNDGGGADGETPDPERPNATAPAGDEAPQSPGPPHVSSCLVSSRLVSSRRRHEVKMATTRGHR